MTHPKPDPDESLRHCLREGLTQAAAEDSRSLQERVLTQWAQRHAAVQAGVQTTLNAGHGSLSLSPRVWGWATLCVALLVLVLVYARSQRPDPDIEELLQPDVLSQISLGEL